MAFPASSHVLNLVSGGGSSVLRYFLPLTQKLRTKIFNISSSSKGCLSEVGGRRWFVLAGLTC